MQSMQWYLRRLASMSPAEIAWRCQGKLRAIRDRALLSRRTALPDIREIASPGQGLLPPRGTLLAGTEVDRNLASAGFVMSTQGRELLARAEAVARGKLRFFGRDFDYGSVIRWNYEPEAQRATPCCAASTIDYRDHAVTGDCKLVWEPNRHQHLPVLGRAWRLTGNPTYAAVALAHLESWIEQCPFGYGMNWRSPLELAIRVINWVFTLELLRDCPLLTPGVSERAASASYQHIREITRNYSRYSSANNHLIGEAAGTFLACSYFPGFKQSARWLDESRGILEREILRQTYSDGGTCEQATGYHLFVLEFFALAAIVADRAAKPFSREFHDRLRLMFEFLARLTEGGPMPMLGDGDDGFVVDLGGCDDRVSAWLRVGGEMFQRLDWVRGPQAAGETAWWLLGSSREAAEQPGTGLRSTASEATGLHLLQHGLRNEAVSVIVDAGPHGFGAIAAHGHADALSLVLRLGGQDVLVDPGTYDYFTYPAWREYFRSTRAHNTLVVDNEDQSQMLGPFLWGRRARTRVIEWAPEANGGRLVAEHDGYTCLPDAVVHRRTVELHGTEGRLSVVDELICEGPHDVTQCWHFSEKCGLSMAGDHELRVAVGEIGLTLRLDPCVAVRVFHGSDSPKSGWVSRGYHRKTPGFSVEASCKISGTSKLRTTMTWRTAAPQEAMLHRTEPRRLADSHEQTCGVG